MSVYPEREASGLSLFTCTARSLDNANFDSEQQNESSSSFSSQSINIGELMIGTARP